ncbi:MAG: hypothetical protein FJ267_05755 [Planctomycetes bacterium]|nr:hypothetical protein [Planctomycetota bacterium]
MLSLIDSSLRTTFGHWKDVAFPIVRFFLPIQFTEEDLTIAGIDKDNSHRILRNFSDAKLCNSLVVLYSCVSKGLKEAFIDEIARYFISRMMIASVAFLPEKALNAMINSYMGTLSPEEKNSERTPIGIHKLKLIIPHNPTAKPSSRKYNIAKRISGCSSLDIKFMMSFVNRPYSAMIDENGLITKYHQPLVSY